MLKQIFLVAFNLEVLVVGKINLPMDFDVLSIFRHYSCIFFSWSFGL